MARVCSIFFLLTTFSAFGFAAAQPKVADAEAFVKNAETELLNLSIESAQAAWVSETYITQDSEALVAKAYARQIARTTELVKEAKKFDGLHLSADVRRKLLLMKLSLGLPSPDDPKMRAEVTQLAASLNGSYGTGKYCPGNDPAQCMGIDEIGVRMAKSRDPKELQDLWIGWHRIGPPMRDRYSRLITLSNQGARELGFADTGALWRSGYDMPPDAFSADIDRLWLQVAPLYRELHTYVRRKLIAKYGPAIASRADGMIPAHLVGNMWSQQWGNIYDLVAPPGAPAIADLGAALQAKNVDAKGLVTYGEHFFRSLGFDPLPQTFWDRSMLTKPRDREVVCHASAWDLDYEKDVRLKLCIHISADDFTTVHHELGHNYYQMAYRKQPFLFRGGANDGFHEAIGNAIALSITPAYLKQVGLIDQIPPADAAIPLLLRTALDQVAALPWVLLVDKWRWQVFSGEIPPSQYNEAWWRLREQYQGIAPPVERSESDFDPGAKAHIPQNVPYTRYFLAQIYQFQFYRGMCQAAGYTGPLHGCSFFESKGAGDRLRSMLEMGASKPWPEAMKAITGQSQADASALLEYFGPLMDWLKQQNKGEKSGWTAPSHP